MLTERVLRESKIMVVDDDHANVLLVERLLEWAGFSGVKSYTCARQALEDVPRLDPDLLMLDLRMPDLDGYEFLKSLNASGPGSSFIPVLVFTADGSSEARKRALELGASDFLTKPGDSTEILLRVRNFLKARHLHRELEKSNRELEEKIQARTAELEQTQKEIIERLARAAEYRDDETGEHTKRVAELSVQIAIELGIRPAEAELLKAAAPLHDIGKIGIPDSILLKAGDLSDEEYAKMTEHTTIGASILSGSKSAILVLAEAIALCHHERWDGAGYPKGLKGEEIPMAARIVAVADVFDALTHERPYKTAWPIEKALAEIESQAGKAFDPKVVDAFVRALSKTRVIGGLHTAA